MITSAFIYVINALLDNTIGRLDPVAFPEAFLEALSQISYYFTTFSGYVPMTIILLPFFFVAGSEIFLFIYKIGMWVVRRVPGQG